MPFIFLNVDLYKISICNALQIWQLIVDEPISLQNCVPHKCLVIILNTGSISFKRLKDGFLNLYGIA